MVQVDGAGRTPPSTGALAPASPSHNRRQQVFEALFAELRASGGSARSETVGGRVRADTDRRHDQVNAALKGRDKPGAPSGPDRGDTSSRGERLQRMASAETGARQRPPEEAKVERRAAEPREPAKDADRDSVEPQVEPATQVQDRVEQRQVEQSQDVAATEAGSDPADPQDAGHHTVTETAGAGDGEATTAATSEVAVANPAAPAVPSTSNTAPSTGWQPVGAAPASPAGGHGANPGTDQGATASNRPTGVPAATSGAAGGEASAPSFDKLLDAARPSGTTPAGTGTAGVDVSAAAKAGRTSGLDARAVATPGDTGATHGTIRLSEARAAHELADVVRAGSANGRSHMTLRLDPPDLGVLRIEMRMQEQALTVRMEAQTMAGHDALRSRLSDLRSALEQHGVQVRQVEVEYRPPAPPAQESGDRQNPAQNPFAGGEGWQGSAQRNGDGQGHWRPRSPEDGQGFGPAPAPGGVQEAVHAAGMIGSTGVDLIA